MGTYKVPQNVEAEDKILGPLSMKQFIYAMIGVGYGLLTFAILHKISIIIWAILGLPPMLALLALGLYQRQDQPMETFIIAIAEFFTRPKTRLWQKEPIAEVFRLEPPPPKPEQAVRDPRQVRSQLSQLADLVDTRGWSAKEPELQEADVETPVVDLQGRIGADALAQPAVSAAPLPEVTEDDDMLSATNATAQDLNTLIENTVKSVRAEAMEKMHSPAPAPVAAAAVPAAPAPKAPTKAKPPVKKAASKAAATAPPKAQPVVVAPAVASPAAAQSISGSTVPPSGDILELASLGGDLSVAEIATQANRRAANNLAEGQSVSLRHAQSATF